MKNKSQIKTGILLSYLNIGIGNLVPLFYTPIMLSLLGKSEYGLFRIASSTTSYLSLMAFGVGGAITRFVIKANIDEGKEGEERIFGLFNLLFQIISILTILVGLILTLNLGLFYSNSLSIEELNKMKILVGIMVINTAVGFSATPYTIIVSAHEKFIFIQIMNIISTVAVPIANLVVLYMGFKSIAMAIVSLALNVIVRIAYLAYVHKTLQLKPKYRNMPFFQIKEILAFSFWLFVSSVTSQLFSATDTVIIGTVPALATVGAAVYSVGHTFPSILQSISQVVPNFFMPRANKMVFSGSDNEELTDLTIKVGRIQAYVVALVAFGFVAFGQPFLNFYVGPDYSEAYWVAIIMIIPNCIPLVQSACNSVMQAKNLHSFRAKVYIFIAIANAVSTYFLVQHFGIIGASIPTGLCYILGNGLILNSFFWKKMQLNIPRFWKNILPFFILAIMLCAITIGLSFVIDFNNLLYFFIGVLIFTIAYLLLSWFLILNEYEKDIVLQPLKKLRRRNAGK